MEGMKQEVEAFEATLRNKGQQIEQMRAQLQTFKPGTDNYKNVEEQMAKLAAEGQAQTQLKRKDFLEREAKIYYDTYMEISKAVEQFAQRNGIKLVVRFNSSPIESGDRNSVLEGVNRAVVYQQNLNITDYVLQMLNRNVAGAAAARAGTGAGTARKPVTGSTATPR
jgi:Skp family chaperone for outer membrane proteins